jgi:hypothetical protein
MHLQVSTSARMSVANKRVWLTPLPLTLTPAQFLKLTRARNAQLACNNNEDCAKSAPTILPKAYDEQGESSGHDELSSLCDHDPARILQALLAVPQKPRPNTTWLGTPVHRERAAKRLIEQRRQQAEHLMRQQGSAADLDRVSASGFCSTSGAGQSGKDRGEIKSEPIKSSKVVYDPQSHIKQLESRVMELQRKQEKERAARKVLEQEAAQRIARVRAHIQGIWHIA